MCIPCRRLRCIKFIRSRALHTVLVGSSRPSRGMHMMTTCLVCNGTGQTMALPFTLTDTDAVPILHGRSREPFQLPIPLDILGNNVWSPRDFLAMRLVLLLFVGAAPGARSSQDQRYATLIANVRSDRSQPAHWKRLGKILLDNGEVC